MKIKSDLDIIIPNKLIPIFTSKQRYNILSGGRGSGKSWSIAELLALKAYRDKRLILCTREIQNTIKDSVHKLLADTIDRMKLNSFFEIQRDQILAHNGSRFIFKGLRHSIAEIKSTEGVTDCWVEEAQGVSEESWNILVPTVRTPESQFYITFNPDSTNDPTYERFITNKRDDILHINVNYFDNPFFPDVLRQEMEYDKKTDYDKYLWIWEGQCRQVSDAQIFKNKFVVDSFDSESVEEFYFGADWGFAISPTTLIRSFIKDRNLYLDYEAYGVGVELDEIPALFDSVPLSRKYTIVADSARPETISYISNKGFSIIPAEKGAGSVEDGIEFLKSFEKIIIHPRCKHAIDEFTLYSYKKDRLTGDILPIPLDANNHIIDGLRYSMERINKKVSIRFI